MEKGGVTLLIDSMSYQYLVGAKIDFKDDLSGAQFVIDNPNAVTTCGCGLLLRRSDAGDRRPDDTKTNGRRSMRTPSVFS